MLIRSWRQGRLTTAIVMALAAVSLAGCHGDPCGPDWHGPCSPDSHDGPGWRGGPGNSGEAGGGPTWDTGASSHDGAGGSSDGHGRR